MLLSSDKSVAGRTKKSLRSDFSIDDLLLELREQSSAKLNEIDDFFKKSKIDADQISELSKELESVKLKLNDYVKKSRDTDALTNKLKDTLLAKTEELKREQLQRVASAERTKALILENVTLKDELNASSKLQRQGDSTVELLESEISIKKSELAKAQKEKSIASDQAKSIKAFYCCRRKVY